MKEISKSDVKVSVIPNGLEKYMVFTINTNLIFIDNMQFMNSSLDLSEEFSGEFLRLVKQKGVYPYEYVGSFNKFSENKLPNRCKFFSSLKGKCISKKYYLKALDVWNVFAINTMGDYYDLYLKTYVLLLVHMFEKLLVHVWIIMD